MPQGNLDTSSFELVPVDRIRPDPDQPRKHFDEEGIGELARSLASNGLLQPIAVRPEADGYILIAGERRWRAASMLGWETIPAIVRQDLTQVEASRLQLLENIVRRDLNPVEEARAFRKMLDEGSTIDELGAAVGMTNHQIAWRVEMLEAREDVLHLVATGAIKAPLGHALSRLSHNGQARALRAIQLNGLGTKEAEALCERLRCEEQQVEMFPETRLSPDQVRTVQDFSKAFQQICATLGRIHRMQEEQPEKLAQALRAEGVRMEAQVNEAIRGLNRVRMALESARVSDLATNLTQEEMGHVASD